MTEPAADPIVFAVPKGRILGELEPLLAHAGIRPDADFFDEDSRRLQFGTNHAHISLIRVRSFDVATFVAFGAAQLGVAGSDVLAEFDYPDLYAPLDLGIGRCRLAVAYPANDLVNLRRESHLRIATKYPHTTQRYFAARGIQAECVKLSGAIELAPTLGLTTTIVDLVSSGQTLRANGLVEAETIAEVSSRLIVNRTVLKTRGPEIEHWIGKFREAVHAHAAA